jgi:outer membrane receptor protein involved in Fe transport
VPGTTTTETFFQNVGGVSSKGAEFSGQWKPELLGGKVFFNANLSYNVSKFEDNFSTFLIAGKRLPDFPEVVFQGGVTFEPFDGLVANVSAATSPTASPTSSIRRAPRATPSSTPTSTWATASGPGRSKRSRRG